LYYNPLPAIIAPVAVEQATMAPFEAKPCEQLFEKGLTVDTKGTNQQPCGASPTNTPNL